MMSGFFSASDKKKIGTHTDTQIEAIEHNNNRTVTHQTFSAHSVSGFTFLSNFIGFMHPESDRGTLQSGLGLR